MVNAAIVVIPTPEIQAPTSKKDEGAKMQCEFARQGAYEFDCYCDRECKWVTAGAYFGACSDETKSFEAV